MADFLYYDPKNAGAIGSWAKPAKKKGGGWVPDILQNLVKDVEEFATGIPAAAGIIGGGAVHDVKKVVTGDSGGFHLDDIAKQIVSTSWSDIKTRWKPLVDGNIYKFLDQVEENPLAFALDGTTLLSGGGSAFAKAGKEAALLGKETQATRLAGLTKTAERVDPADTVLREQMATKGKLVDSLGSVWDGPTGELRTGNGTLQIPLSTNPYQRAKQMAGLKLSNKFETAPMFGAARRMANRTRREVDNRTLRNSVTRTVRADEASKALDDLDFRASNLIGFAQSGITKDKLVNMYERKATEIDQEIAAAQQAGEKVNPKLELAKENVTAKLRDVTDDEAWKVASDESQWSDNLRNWATENEALSRENSRLIWEASERTYRGNPVDFETFYDLQRMRERRFIDDPELDQLLNDERIDVGDLMEAQASKYGAPGKYAYVRPHMSTAEVAKGRRATAEVGLDVRGVATNPKLQSAQRNDMILFRDAMDVLHPNLVVEAARDGARYEGELAKLDAVMRTAVDVTGMEPPKGYVRIKSDQMVKRVVATRNWLGTDAKVIMGEGPELVAVRDRFDELLASMERGDLYAPKPMVDELVRQSKDWGRFVQTYDKATAGWRHLALTARPAWVSSNVIGALVYLATTHGVIKSTAALFAAVKMGGKGPVSLDRVAPEALAAGFMRTALDEVRGRVGKETPASATMRILNKAGDAVGDVGQKMLYVNAVLSDDIPRRAAFLATIKDPVSRIMAKTGDDFETAALKYLADPAVIDKIAVKVMDDLIDFRNLSRFEREYVRRFMPFVSWIKGSTSRTWRIASEQPELAWAGFNLNEYAQDELTQKFGGELPDYLKGLISLGTGKDGNENIIATNGLNPFGTVGELAGIAQSTLLGSPKVGSSNPASMVNPIPKALVEAFTNRNLFYGTTLDPTDTTSYGQRFAQQLVQGVPQVRLGQKLNGTLSSESVGYTPMYDQNVQDLLMSYFLLPVKSLNVAEAKNRAAAENAGTAAPVI